MFRSLYCVGFISVYIKGIWRPFILCDIIYTQKMGWNFRNKILECFVSHTLSVIANCLGFLSHTSETMFSGILECSLGAEKIDSFAFFLKKHLAISDIFISDMPWHTSSALSHKRYRKCLLCNLSMQRND